MLRRAFTIGAILVAVLAYLRVSADRRARSIAAYDQHVLATIERLRPRLPALAAALDEQRALSPPPACATVRDQFPICLRNGRRVLLLAAAPPEADMLHPLIGLVYDPEHETTSHFARWYVDALLASLGSGWYHIRAYPGKD